MTAAGDDAGAAASLGSAAGLIEGLLDAVWLVRPGDLRVMAANAAAGDLIGVDATQLRGRAISEMFAPEDGCLGRDALGLANGLESQMRVRRADGICVAVTRRVSRFQLAGGEPGLIVVARQHNPPRRVEDELAQRVAELSATLESTADGILVTDLAGRLRSFNRSFGALWGLPDTLLSARDDEAVLAWMRDKVLDPADYMDRLTVPAAPDAPATSDTVTLRSGAVLERVTQPQCSGGRTIGQVHSFRDVTERLRRIDALSHTDALTGLPNRRVLADRVGFALALGQRDGTPFALMFVNLDGFKHINDTLDRGFGDCVLVDVAQRLTASLRQVDTVACLGGDEFVLLVHQTDVAGAEIAARRVLDEVQRPFTQGGLSFTVTCSIGIAMYPGDGDSLDALMRSSGQAMQKVKEAGRAAFRFHQPSREAAELHRRSHLELDHAMRQALVNGHFRVHYQPLVDMYTGEVRGAEALIRWRDPQLGDVSPAEFIPVAEASGFIVAIGDWVLRQAVQQAADWRAQGRLLTISVNVSPVQFQRVGFVDRVAAVLAAARLPAPWLELELTESILINDARDALARLQALSKRGVRLALDDFGTGYSSLGYLKRFPINRLKIDRSFVKGLPDDASDAAIAHAIVDFARALDIELVAEGVETEPQRQFLLHAGCAQYQGFLFAPALHPVHFEERLDASLRATTSERAVR